MAKRLIEAGLLDATQMTVTGRTIGEEANTAVENILGKTWCVLSNPSSPQAAW